MPDVHTCHSRDDHHQDAAGIVQKTRSQVPTNSRVTSKRHMHNNENL